VKTAEWVVRALTYQFGWSDEEIAALSPEEAERFVRERWSQPTRPEGEPP
jgi:hypothetical protein